MKMNLKYRIEDLEQENRRFWNQLTEINKRTGKSFVISFISLAGYNTMNKVCSAALRVIYLILDLNLQAKLQECDLHHRSNLKNRDQVYECLETFHEMLRESKRNNKMISNELTKG